MPKVINHYFTPVLKIIVRKGTEQKAAWRNY